MREFWRNRETNARLVSKRCGAVRFVVRWWCARCARCFRLQSFVELLRSQRLLKQELLDAGEVLQGRSERRELGDRRMEPQRSHESNRKRQHFVKRQLAAGHHAVEEEHVERFDLLFELDFDVFVGAVARQAQYRTRATNEYAANNNNSRDKRKARRNGRRWFHRRRRRRSRRSHRRMARWWD
jgi:hypothetical protein